MKIVENKVVSIKNNKLEFALYDFSDFNIFVYIIEILSDNFHDMENSFIEKVFENSPKKFDVLILDFNHIHYLSSSAVGSLVHNYKQLKKNNSEANIRIINVHKKINKLFRTLNLHALIPWDIYTGPGSDEYLKNKYNEDILVDDPYYSLEKTKTEITLKFNKEYPNDLITSKKIIEEILLSLLNNDILELVIDFDGISYIDSAFMGFMVSIKKNLNNKGCKIYLKNICPSLLKIFKIVLFDKIFDIKD